MESQTEDVLHRYEEPFGAYMYEETKIKVNANYAVDAFPGSK